MLVGLALGLYGAASHQKALAHAASFAHVVAHALPLHPYGAHAVLDDVWHTPAPLHDCPLCVPPLHVVDPHAVPAAYCAHAPEPLHVPFVPQLALPWFAQSLSGLVPVATFRHLPSAAPLTAPCLLLLHAMHVPAHAVSQQYPSTQFWLFTHCDDVVHALPAPAARSGWHV